VVSQTDVPEIVQRPLAAIQKAKVGEVYAPANQAKGENKRKKKKRRSRN
jgi:hypothetical protein